MTKKKTTVKKTKETADSVASTVEVVFLVDVEIKDHTGGVEFSASEADKVSLNAASAQYHIVRGHAEIA